MIKHELIKKGNIGHALLSSTATPNIFIPAKVIIQDVKFDESNPQYLVKVIMFYDTTYFVKTNFMNMAFKTKFDRQSRSLDFPSDFKPTKPEEIVNHMGDASKYFIVVDSVCIMKYKQDMLVMYNKIQDYIIEREINMLKDSCMRPAYTGKFKIGFKVEFFNRLKRMFVDLVANSDKEWDDFVSKF